jgi:signal transduction histidine kinase
MNEHAGESLTLACVTDDSPTAAVLHETLIALFPRADVMRVDTAAERTIPPVVHCAIVDATVHDETGVDILRGLRARGYAGAAVVVLHPAHAAAGEHAESAHRMGARACPLDSGFPSRLGQAVVDALRVTEESGGDSPTGRAVSALRHNQRLVAAGELAMQLQHSLNNPLAALLAEAQLLEMEQLAPDHRASVRRIIELCRRVVNVVRGLDGVGRA